MRFVYPPPFDDEGTEWDLSDEDQLEEYTSKYDIDDLMGTVYHVFSEIDVCDFYCEANNMFRAKRVLEANGYLTSFVEGSSYISVSKEEQRLKEHLLLR